MFRRCLLYRQVCGRSEASPLSVAAWCAPGWRPARLGRPGCELRSELRLEARPGPAFRVPVCRLSETGIASVGAGFARSETVGTIVGEKQAFSVRCLLSVVLWVSCVGWAGLAVVSWVSCAGWAGLSVVLWVSCVGWAGLSVVSWVSSARREQPEGAPGVRCLYLGRAQDPRPRVQWPLGLPVGASHRAPSTGYPHDLVYFGDNVTDPYI